MIQEVDFHSHTVNSDGTLTATELMELAKKQGIKALALTDHDTTSGLDEALAAGKKLGVELIPGIEISVVYDSGTMHILGHFIDHRSMKLQEAIRGLQDDRNDRNPQIIEKLNALGIEITLKEVERESGGGQAHPNPEVESGQRREVGGQARPNPEGESGQRREVGGQARPNPEGESGQRREVGGQVGRPHFARVLVKKGHVKDFEEAFKKYLGKGAPAYVDKRRISPEEGIRMIREAGGIAVLAHPKTLNAKSSQEFNVVLDHLVASGLGGIEAYSSCQDEKEAGQFRAAGEERNIFITGGSDFHGDNKSDVELGNMGRWARLSYGLVKAMRDHLNLKGLS